MTLPSAPGPLGEPGQLGGAAGAFPRPGPWQMAKVTEIRRETATAKTFRLELPTPVPYLAGQHFILRLTAPDGYVAQRSYSVGSAPAASGPSGSIELTVERLPDGEVSSFLHDVVAIGDELQVRGPIGGWFVWRPEQREPIQLVAGGSGIAPLMAMVRASQPLVADGTMAPMRVLYSVRTPQGAIFGDALRRLDAANLVELSMLYTRSAPEGWAHRIGRIAESDLIVNAWPPDRGPTCYVCGPSPFVEAAASMLVNIGHNPGLIRTERFGPV